MVWEWKTDLPAGIAHVADVLHARSDTFLLTVAGIIPAQQNASVAYRTTTDDYCRL